MTLTSQCRLNALDAHPLARNHLARVDFAVPKSDVARGPSRQCRFRPVSWLDDLSGRLPEIGPVPPPFHPPEHGR